MIAKLFGIKSVADTRSAQHVPPGFDTALEVFRRAASEVPAYKKFLAAHKIKPSSIRTYADFQQVPPVTKENYLTKYPLKELTWGGDFSEAEIFSMSSGSSGQPFIWPRGDQGCDDAVVMHDLLLRQNFQTDQKQTLVIIAFAMGTWIAGTYTLQAMLGLVRAGHKIVTITPGIDKVGVLPILQRLSPQFEQTIIFGYPPFVKDIVDYAVQEGVDLQALNTKIVVAGENISEKWRSYMLKKIGAADANASIIGIYGTADAGLMGNETSLTIYTRRESDSKVSLFEKIFPSALNLPTLVAYDPARRFVEEQDHYLLFTVNNSLPLVRYKILDQGRVLSKADLKGYLDSEDVEVPAEYVKRKPEHFLALYSRTDIATTFYAIDIYPENIKSGVEAPELQKYVTGKFILKNSYDELTQEQTLHLYVELKRGVKSSERVRRQILKSVIKGMRTSSSEYNRLYQELYEKANPVVHLVANGSPEFDYKIKHKWVDKL